LGVSRNDANGGAARTFRFDLKEETRLSLATNGNDAETAAVRTLRFGLKEKSGFPLATNGNNAETAVKPKETQRLSSKKNRRRRDENLSGTLF
jgi:hypothetical protein